MGNYWFEIATLSFLVFNTYLLWFTTAPHKTVDHNFAVLSNTLDQIQAKLESLEQQLQNIETEISTR